MSSQLKMGIVVAATVAGGGIGWHFGGTKRERVLGGLAGGMFGFGASRFATGMMADAPAAPAAA